MRSMLLVGLVFGSGCGGTSETNPCKWYESAMEDCHEQAMEALGEEDGNSWLATTIDCPDELDMSEVDVEFYTCLSEVWGDADCSAISGVLQASVDAAECGRDAG